MYYVIFVALQDPHELPASVCRAHAPSELVRSKGFGRHCEPAVCELI